VISLYYYLRVIATMYFGQAGRPAFVLGQSTAMGLAISALLVVGLGVGADVLLASLRTSALLP
jgi:NADH:ubiquinone oxidoreductase subunit 2 (subunit N)